MTRQTLHTDESAERAVSPVIGVVLMVAITVILAATIGTFVMGFGQDAVSQQAQASVSIGGNASSVTLASVGSGAEGIKCSDVNALYDGSGDNADRNDGWTVNIGESIDCSDANSVVAFSNSTEVQNTTIQTFD